MAPKATFDVWMKSVDRFIAAELGGLTSEDLPDCCYREWYEDGMAARTAARKAIKNA